MGFIKNITLIFVGEKGSGKTTTISLLKGKYEDNPKPSTAIDF